jgi:hypothetical protein
MQPKAVQARFLDRDHLDRPAEAPLGLGAQPRKQRQEAGGVASLQRTPTVSQIRAYAR